MPSPLRAYLMVFDPQGSPQTKVHTDLKDIVDEWDAHASDDVSAVLHIGFDRVATRHFENLAQRFPGHVLLTEGAKYCLPKGYRSSQSPIGTVRDEEMYLGLTGWGYAADDPSPPINSQSANPKTVDGAASKRELWIEGYVMAFPADRAKLDQARIACDVSYLENEHELPHALRKSLGQFRQNHLTLGNTDDPCLIARRSPPWLLERHFDTLPISVRVANVFSQTGISTVSDLASTSKEELLRAKNFGKTSIRNVLEALNQGIADGPYSQEDELEKGFNLAFLPALRNALGNLSDREKDILVKRMGLDGPQMTLAEIGDEYGVSRERIRQVEAKAVTKIIATEIWDDVFERKIVELLADRREPLPLRALGMLDDWFDGAHEKPKVFSYWLDAIPTLDAHLISIDNVDYITGLNQNEWENAEREAKALMQGGIGLDWSEELCRDSVHGLLASKGRELRDVLWDRVAVLCRFADTGAGRILQSYGRGAEQAVLVVMEESDKALHYSDLAEAITARFEQDFDVRRIHNAAANVGLLLGRGTYGLRKHIPMLDDDFLLLGDWAEEIVLDGPEERQWHASEILRILADRAEFQILDVDQYVVSAALNGREAVEGLGRLVWRRKGEAGTSSHARIDIRQALLFVLEEAGHPLRTNELRKLLNEKRGTNQTFQIVPADPLIRVGTSLWGINDRDVPIKRQDQGHLINLAKSILTDLRHGIHVSEATKYFFNLPEIDPEALFSLLTLDNDLRVSQGRYLFLDSWGEPRRLTLSEALDRVLSEDQGAWSLEALHTRVMAEMARSCEKTALSGALQGCGAERDENGMWFRGDEDD